ncbi:protein NRT1/ PTR FAMILY 4.5-like [Andrographis paniculata]|uniref:protein NRT1/ PTR FAMILY 4.5-like n=1 Tax=Andrographis paniculata TaxID=175694 RepID=UPI0021E86F1A|nr:protein NRT1/ PTR FAMILY 4.5-like [Andrographis paniculata]
MEEYARMGESEIVEGKVDWRGKPARKDKHGGIRASIPISAAFGFEAMVMIALASNLVQYFNRVMHFDSADSANHLTNILAVNYLLTVVMAVVADAYAGRFLTILISSSIVFLAVGVLGIQAHLPNLKPPPCNNYDPSSHCTPVHGANAALLFGGLYMLSIGSAGAKATLPSHGADQFDEKDPKEAMQKSSYFNWLLVATSAGNIFAVTFIVWIQDNRGWDWGFGTCTIAMLFGIIVFLAGLPVYRIHVPHGSSVLTELLQVVVAAVRNVKLRIPEDSNELYEINDEKEGARQEERLPHTNAFRCLDKAAIRTSSSRHSPKDRWKQCTVTQVENLKILLNLLPIFLCSTLMTLCLAQLQTFTVEQAATMDLKIGKTFKIPPGSLPVIPFTALLIITPLYDKLFVPFAQRLTGIPTGITYLQRVGVGLLLASASMAVAALVETKRRHIAIDNGMIDAIPMKNPLPISVFWLAIQAFIFGIADLFTFVGLLEFFYTQVPSDIKAVSSCFLWCSSGVGYFLSSILVDVVNRATKGIGKNGVGWLSGNNLNRGRLDLFYGLLSILTLIDFFVYLILAKRYVYRHGSINVTASTEKNVQDKKDEQLLRLDA